MKKKTDTLTSAFSLPMTFKAEPIAPAQSFDAVAPAASPTRAREPALVSRLEFSSPTVKEDPITEDEFCWAVMKRLPFYQRCEKCQENYRSWAYHRAVCKVANQVALPQEIERSPQASDGPSAHYPYKSRGMPDGDKMKPYRRKL